MAEVDVGSETYTTYADLDTADVYALAASHATAFRAASTDDRGRFLVTATRILDRQIWKSDYDTFAERAVVQDIIDASIELAIDLANGSKVQTNQTTAGEISSLSAGSVSISYRRTAAGTSPTRFPLIVQELLYGYLGDDASGNSLWPKVNGVDEETVFPIDLGVTGGI